MGHVADRWHVVKDGRKIRSDRYGKGSRWQAVWHDPATRNERTKAFAVRVDAEAFITTIAADQLRGSYVDVNAGRMPFDAFAIAFQSSRTGNPSTLERERIVLRRSLLPFFGSRPFGDLRRSDVREWRATRGARVARTTLELEGSLLKQIFDAAVDDGIIAVSPWRPMKRTDKRDPRPTWRTVWGVERVLAIAAAHPLRLQPLVRLAAASGIRQGEAFAVDVDAVDDRWHQLHVARQVKRVDNVPVFGLPKGGQVRDVPIAQPVIDMLAEHLRRFPPVEVTLPWEKPDGPPVTARLLFTGGRGVQMRRDGFNAEWRRALVELGITPAGKTTGMHQLRHHYASLLIASGEDVRVVASRLGHRATETLETYAHLFDDEVDRTADIVAAAHFGKPLTDQPRTRGPLRAL